MAIVKVVLAIVFLCLARPIFSWLQRYRTACRIGLPVIITPVSPFNPLWWIVGPILFPLMKRVPITCVNDWALFGDVQWPARDRGKAHERYGPAFILVNPTNSVLVLSDPGAIEDCLKRINTFIKPSIIYSAIEFYGPNVDTTNGDTWQRHRRLTTPPFNERNSSLVWRESVRQATSMRDSWVAKDQADGVATSSDTAKLALHVLCSAGFGRSYDFNVGATHVPEGHALSYRDSLATILENTLLAIIVAMVKLPTRISPKSFRKMRLAQDEFRQYMVEMVEEEREVGVRSSADQDNLLSAMVRANEMSKEDGKSRYSLTDDEIRGNIFIWNLAGHDTTAGALVYAFTLLAAHPDVQEWIREELVNVMGNTEPRELDYQDNFPQLKRCLALMYETLRVYQPVPALAKQHASAAPSQLTIDGRDILVPEDYMLTLNTTAIHYASEYWSPDPSTWRPQRFLDTANESISPAPGTFVPWVSGPRICPGKKFAQVEFVATLAVCLRRHRVMPVLEPGETLQQAKQRILDLVDDSAVGANPTLKMVHPERAKLRWEAI